ncbi:MAG: Maf family protein [Candidatus Gastranaerophilales bacterium]|nr:Maf family protein [Candidatus Gastranaerophilales bacterium]
MKRIILASNSPRRKELLKNVVPVFEVHPSKYEETLDTKEFSYKKIETLALNKAKKTADEITNNAVIIGADTVVVLNNKILTKPADRNDAINMIKSLSNVEHQVVTSICIIDKYTNSVKIKSVTTKVHFAELTEKMVETYVDTYKPFDKAGAYGIQELPPEFVKYIDGSIENVIGLCTETVLSMLEN